MGGDHAPHVVVEGAVDALRQTGNRFNVVLVGKTEAIEAELQKYQASPSIRIENAPETVNFDDDALAPLRTKKQSSIAIGMELQGEHPIRLFYLIKRRALINAQYLVVIAL